MFNDSASREIALSVTVRGDMIECNSMAEAAVLRQADEVLSGDGACDPCETVSLAAALSKYKHFQIARELNILAEKMRIAAMLQLPEL